MQRLPLLLSSLGLATAAAAHTQPMQTPELMRAMARAQHLAQAAPEGRRIDTTPPVLKAFGAGTAADARLAKAGIPIDLTLADDLSGVAYVYVEARGPSGQEIDVYKTFDFAARKAQASLGLMLPPESEPGAWQITYLYAYDLAGNDLSLGQSALDALGNTRFTVQNDVYDVTPPRLLRGRILTPSFSSSKLARGVPAGGELQSPGVGIAVTDNGGPGSAGVEWASMTFCMVDDWGGCYYPTFSISSDNSSGMPGDGSVDLVLGAYGNYGWYDRPDPGTYVLDSVRLTDFAGNTRDYYNKDFGGDTDFSKYFSSTTIVVTP